MSKFIVMMLLFVPLAAFSQDAPTVESGLDVFGQIGMSTTGKTHFINFGGPAIKLKYEDKGVGLSFFPSFRLTELPGGNVAQPQLGAGPFLEYKKFSLIFPAYALKEDGDTKTSLKFTFGLGYKF